MTLDFSTPVLLLGGKENALSITRHLGRLGVTVRAAGPASCWALYSRYCTEAMRVPSGETQQKYWKRLLLGNDRRLDGHIVWALSDDAIEFINDNRDQLAVRFKLDDSDARLQAAFLDKMETLKMAAEAGVDAPRHWPVRDVVDLADLRQRISFPAAVKPIQSHKFTKVFGKKLFIVEDSFEELEAHLRNAWAHDIEVFVVEMIPGPDSDLSSYYTYCNIEGHRLFDFTKSVIRRWPVNRGNACYHKSGWLPETAEAGRRFFEHVGLRGLGNIEFKRDRRDGKLKIIEVNARFTAAQELVRRAGVPIDLIIYCHLTGQSIPTFRPSTKEMRMWYPVRDFLGFLELRKKGQLTFRGWMKSVTTTVPVFPLVSLMDPAPMLGAGLALAQRLFA